MEHGIKIGSKMSVFQWLKNRQICTCHAYKKTANVTITIFSLHTKMKHDARMVALQFHLLNRKTKRIALIENTKFTAKIHVNLSSTSAAYCTSCSPTWKLPLLLLEALWICWTHLRRTGLYSAYSLNTAHPPEVAKTAIFWVLGRPIYRCLQPYWNSLKTSHELEHITKRLLWKFEEDRSRVEFRATVGRTWTFRWEKESLCTVVSHHHTRGASFYETPPTLRGSPCIDLSSKPRVVQVAHC